MAGRGKRGLFPCHPAISLSPPPGEAADSQEGTPEPLPPQPLCSLHSLMGPECPNPAGTTSGPGPGTGTRGHSPARHAHAYPEEAHTCPCTDGADSAPQSPARPSAGTKATSLPKTTEPPLLTRARGQPTGLAWQAWPLSANKGDDNEERNSKLSQYRRRQVQERGHRRGESVWIAPRVGG